MHLSPRAVLTSALCGHTARNELCGQLICSTLWVRRDAQRETGQLEALARLVQFDNGANIGDELGVWYSPLDPSTVGAKGFLCTRDQSALHRYFQDIWGGIVRLCIKQKQKQTLNKGKHNPEA